MRSRSNAAGESPGSNMAVAPSHSTVSRFSPTEQQRLLAAREHAWRLRDDATTANAADLDLATAELLSQLGLDADAIAAALLRTAAEKFRPDANTAAAPSSAAQWLSTTFGAEVARLQQNAQRARQIEALSAAVHDTGPEHAARLERLRKMLLAMAEDVRVVLIMLAERVCLMRRLGAEGEAQRRGMAQDTMDLFAPLANRLGVWQLKWELEDLSFRHLEPERYQRIARLLDAKRLSREQVIAAVTQRLKQALLEAGITGELSGRSKHIYSIWKKMQNKDVDFEALNDIRAVRVVVPEVRDCYAVLGIVHDLWEPVTGEFDDYIARPKANNYRSLHTAVVANGQTLEVQIRTAEMHRESELGVAAHWRYKEGGRVDKAFDSKIAWLRQILDWKTDLVASHALPEKLRSGLFDERVYVLTPQGRIVDLPAGATPIDFAYHLHTDLGHRCRGAKVDGAIVPLNYHLKNAQTVEITAAKQGGPSRDWLNPEQGYLASSRALAKVRHWFKQQFVEQEIATGRAVLERELARLGLSGHNLERLAHELGCADVNEMLALMGRAVITPRQIELRLAPPEIKTDAAPQLSTGKTSGTSAGIMVLGVGNIATVLAKCCKPVPPDAILGFVSKARGVTVHRAECGNVARLAAPQRERLMPASWGNTAEAPFSADIEVRAEDRQGLLRDVVDAIAREKVNVTAVNTISKNNQASMHFTVEITRLEHLARVLKMVQEVRGVVSTARR